MVAMSHMTVLQNTSLYTADIGALNSAQEITSVESGDVIRTHMLHVPEHVPATLCEVSVHTYN